MILYKYFGPQRIMDIFKYNKIRYTQPEAFNDPFEFKPHISKIISQDKWSLITDQELTKVLEELWESEESKKLCEKLEELNLEEFKLLLSGFLSKFIYECQDFISTQPTLIKSVFQRLVNENIGVFSLSETKNNLLMWAHYANCHTGFVVGFNSDYLGKCQKVKYCGYRPSSTLQNLIEQEMDSLTLAKSKHWKYEKEWRIIRSLKEVKSYDGGDSLYPIYLFDFSPKAICEVIFGCRMKKDDKARIVNLVSETKHIRIKQAIEDKEKFKLAIHTLKKAEIDLLGKEESNSKDIMKIFDSEFSKHLDKLEPFFNQQFEKLAKSH